LLIFVTMQNVSNELKFGNKSDRFEVAGFVQNQK
jgi:hypothetical protein